MGTGKGTIGTVGPKTDYAGGGLDDDARSVSRVDSSNQLYAELDIGPVPGASPVHQTSSSTPSHHAHGHHHHHSSTGEVTSQGVSESGERDAGERAHKFDANPSKMLRHLLGDYVRGAECVYPINLYDCECWESPDAIEMERGPDVTVPFCMRVEFGLGAAVAEHTSTEDFTTNFSGEASAEGLGPDFSLYEVIQDKSFIKVVSG